MPEHELVASLREAFVAGNDERLEGESFEISMEVIHQGNRWPDDLLEALLALFDWATFLQAEHSSLVVFQLYVNWDELSTTQRDTVLRVLAQAYPRFADRTSCFYFTSPFAWRGNRVMCLWM